MNLNEVLDQITGILDTGLNIVGFVSPSHFIPQMKIIIRALEMLGYQPTWVFNTNGYDKVSTLRTLEGIIDVYLPDFKYFESDLSRQFSDAPDYPEVAIAALKEMYRQKGSALQINDQGYAESGILIRHLVLPGQENNTHKVLKFIAEEVSHQLHIGLMSQYYPTPAVYSHPVLGRSLSEKEYREAVSALEEFGLHPGFIQGLGSFNHYKPDFDKNHPFEPD